MPSMAPSPFSRRLYQSLSVLFTASILSLPKVSAQTVVAGSATGAATGSCGWAQQCGIVSPCCSEFGYCGTGSACLSGCNPSGSNGPGYCAPVPVCQNANYTFQDTSRIQVNDTSYMGDASMFDFTLDHPDSGVPLASIVSNDNLNLLLTQQGGGTRLSTTRSVLYGTITASVQTTGAVGVVTAFITMSGVKDEIDFEWTGNNSNQVQSNYFWEGDVANYTHGATGTATNRASSFIEYAINWTPSQLQWLVNGNVIRTLTKESTEDPSIPGLFHYPQTPSRVQISIWPAGISSQPQGTIDWSGGLIDWSSSLYTAKGYFISQVQWLSIECYTGSDLVVPFVASNTSNSTASNSTRLSRRNELNEREDLLWTDHLLKRAATINSYIWGTNNSVGQVGLFTSNAATIINSIYSTGENMIISDPLTNPSTGKSSSSGGWWSNLKIYFKVLIIIGGVAVFLLLFVATCTCIARRHEKSKLKYAQVGAPAAGLGKTDQIPLVEKKQQRPRVSSNPDEGLYPPRQDLHTHDSVTSFGKEDLYYGGGGAGNAAAHDPFAMGPDEFYPAHTIPYVDHPHSGAYSPAPAPAPGMAPYGYYPQQYQSYQQHYQGYGGQIPYDGSLGPRAPVWNMEDASHLQQQHQQQQQQQNPFHDNGGHPQGGYFTRY